MNNTKKTTLTFRLLKRLHLIDSEEKHGRINPFSLIAFAFGTLWRRFIFNYAYKAYIFEFAYKHHLRPAIWRALGCKVGKRVHIGHQVRIDFGNAERITVAVVPHARHEELPRWHESHGFASQIW